MVAQLVSSGTAGAVSRTAVAPLARVKVILQVQHCHANPYGPRYAGTLDALARIGAEEGYRSFWRGNLANLLRIPPATAVKFVSYEWYKEALQQAWAPPRAAGARRSRAASPLWLKLGAGSLSGLTAMACTYPLEVAHTRLAADMARRGQRVRHRGVLACVATTVRDEGVFSMYRGMGVAAARTVPFLGVSFALYDALKPATRSRRGETLPGAIASRTLRGAVATLVAQTLVFPLDTVKRRLQFDRRPPAPTAHLPQYRGAVHCAQQMLRHEGWRSFYRGLPANALRTMPGAALQFVVYEYVKSVMTNEEFVG